MATETSTEISSNVELFIKDVFKTALTIVGELYVKDGGKVILSVKDPDSTTFKEWEISESGKLKEFTRG